MKQVIKTKFELLQNVHFLKPFKYLIYHQNIPTRNVQIYLSNSFDKRKISQLKHDSIFSGEQYRISFLGSQ